MEDEATAHAGRAVSPGRGQGSADRSGPPQPDPCYSPSPPPGLTSRGRLREVQPPAGPPLPPGQYTTTCWDRPHRAESRAPLQAARGSGPHRPLGIVVPIMIAEEYPHPAHRRLYPTGLRAQRTRRTRPERLTGKKFWMPDDVLSESGAGLHFPTWPEGGRTRK